MANAEKFITMIWTTEVPIVSSNISEHFIQHFTHKGL